MAHPYSRSLVEILRSTLGKLEQGADFRQDDPAVAELKRHVVRAIAELEVAKASESTLESSDRMPLAR
jgi:hypothetical protein